jgi:hypothetical protein
MIGDKCDTASFRLKSRHRTIPWRWIELCGRSPMGNSLFRIQRLTEVLWLSIKYLCRLKAFSYQAPFELMAVVLDESGNNMNGCFRDLAYRRLIHTLRYCFLAWLAMPANNALVDQPEVKGTGRLDQIWLPCGKSDRPMKPLKLRHQQPQNIWLFNETTWPGYALGNERQWLAGTHEGSPCSNHWSGVEYFPLGQSDPAADVARAAHQSGVTMAGPV